MSITHSCLSYTVWRHTALPPSPTLTYTDPRSTSEPLAAIYHPQRHQDSTTRPSSVTTRRVPRSWPPDMLQATVVDRTRFETESPVPTNPLLQTLLNRLVLDNIIPYLPVYSLLSLASTSRDFRSLVYESPGVFRHLDLSKVKTAQFDIDGIDHGGQVWRNVQLDENLTEDE